MAQQKSKSKPSADTRPATGPVTLLIGTRKGAFFLKSDRARRRWTMAGPHFLGHIIYHVVLDPRDRKTLLCAARAGHLGPTLYRSTDSGRGWKEAQRPPAFPKADPGAKGQSVDHTFWLTPGHASQPGVWYAGTSPPALFRTTDGGITWDGVEGFNSNPMRMAWTGGDQEQGPPGGATLHSINVDPRDPRHLYIGVSAGGVFESTDGGAGWKPINNGVAADFLPSKDAEYGHDAHCVRLHPLAPDRIYHQNHCGMYRLDRPGEKWERIGNAMPKKIGDIGFPLVLHPRDPDTLWVFPMDGSTVWPRVSPGGKPAAYVSRDGGRSWHRQDKGLPAKQGWFTVKRQAMGADSRNPLGLYFGTTGGEVWASTNEGARWTCIARHLPEIYSVEATGS